MEHYFESSLSFDHKLVRVRYNFLFGQFEVQCVLCHLKCFRSDDFLKQSDDVVRTFVVELFARKFDSFLEMGWTYFALGVTLAVIV